MIVVRGLQKSFGEREALRSIDLRFARGRITGLAGPNASGKSTLIKCILGLAIPQSGEILVDGKLADARGEVRRLIGYLPQNPSFPNNLSLQELMEMLEDLRRQKARKKDELVSYFGLQMVLAQPFGELSGGTKQKVAALAAFMFDAPIIICDEPTAGLDPLSRIKFKDLLRLKAGEGKTIVLVSHFMGEIDQLASELVFLAEGKVMFSGKLEELRRHTGEEDLERALTRLFAAGVSVGESGDMPL